MNTCEKAVMGESKVYQKMVDAGLDVKWSALTNRMSAEDFIVNGAMIDVKYSNVRSNGDYNFNCHHHAVKQKGIDFYICITNLNNVFVFPSELISGKTLRITRKQIDRGRYDYFKENWGLIKNFAKK